MSQRRETTPPPQKAGARPAAEKAPARTILVVDPDPRVRAVVVNALNGQGYKATGTDDPATGVRAGRRNEVDLVLIDLGMSVLDVVPRWQRRASDGNPGRAAAPVDKGYAALRPLHLDPASFRHLAVVLPEAPGADRSPAFRFGVVDYVPKPVQPRLLLERLEEIFEAVDAPRPQNVLELITTPVNAKPLSLPDRVAGPRSMAPPPGLSPDPSEEVPRTLFESLPPGLRSVLIADGDAGSRGFMRALLAPHGFTVYEAEDGTAALAVALSRRPWLIVSEVNMPRMDGFEFCRRVRDHALLRRTPLVLYSAWDDYNERYLGLKLGADEYLSKLTPVRELLIRLQLILRRYCDLDTHTRKGSGMEGTLELIGIPGMLQMLHLGRLSGVCTVHSGPRTAVVTLQEGEIVGARCGALRSAEAIYALLSWNVGQFAFAPGEVSETARPLQEGFDYLLLEGCRRLDESQRDAADETR